MQQNGKENTQIKQPDNSDFILDRLTAYAEACEKEGIYPYEGRWLSADEIDEQIHRKQLKSRIHLVELGSLFALVYVYVIFMGILLSRFAY